MSISSLPLGDDDVGESNGASADGRLFSTKSLYTRSSGNGIITSEVMLGEHPVDDVNAKATNHPSDESTHHTVTFNDVPTKQARAFFDISFIQHYCATIVAFTGLLIVGVSIPWNGHD